MKKTVFSAAIVAVMLTACSGDTKSAGMSATDSPDTAATTAPSTTIAPSTTVVVRTGNANSCPSGEVLMDVDADGWGVCGPIPTTTMATLPEIAPDFFEISLFEISRECFGSAGALVIVEPDLIVRDIAMLEGRIFTIVYEIYGDEDGVLTANLETDGVSGYSYDQQMISTPTCDSSVSATVTGVRER